ncbi:Cys-tRNA(Pro) deacylase [uncultured Rheinheimera sp.]|uniref:Cys-tRNA(Pro) deacylase n=1 Tax=uncultured Rheinheimera sp. TaxID=400532 RepID=UPI00259AA398|nr:Cys-tRNA(Pro) deacylase [uncultured Rheinheimera sp.]
MTPAVLLLKKLKVPHQVLEYQHDPAAESYGLEAATKLGLAPVVVFKTLVAALDGKELVTAIVPVDQLLNMKQLAKAAGAKKAAMAAAADVERSSGYVLGGVSPLGQKKQLRTFIDESAAAFETIYVSAGKRGLEIGLKPAVLQACLNAKLVSLCQHESA